MLTGTAETVFVVDTAKFNTTPSSYKLTKSSLATDAKGRASQAIPVVAGQVLRISIAYSGDTATAAGINVVVNEAAVAPASGAVNDANRTRVTTLVNNGACTTGWTVFNTTTYTVPAGITAISLAIWSGVNGPVNLSFDDPYVSLASNTYSVSGPRTGADGGYDGTALNEIPIDSAKSYRFIVPVRINNGSRASQVYFGPQNAGKCCTINTSTVFVNPYFCNASTVALTDGAWYLMVGYIYPAGSTGTTSNDAGIYDCSTGQKVVSGASFCFAAGVTSIGHRAYQYYADIGSLVEFGAPMVHCVDGSEPQLRTWMRSTSSDIVVGAVGNSGLFNSAITRSVSSGQVAYQSGSIGTFVKADVNRNTLITGNCEVVIGLAVPSVSFPVGNYFISIGGDILSNGAVIGSYYYQSTFSNIAPISGTTGNSLTINIPIYITYPAPLAALPAGNCVLTAAISASIYTSIGYTAGTAPVAMVACTSTYRVHVTELIV
jgi:hypothetical protein